MKRLKSWRSVVLGIVLIGLMFGGWYFTRQTLSDVYPKAWSDWRDKLQTAVAGYRNASSGALPAIGGNVTVNIGGEKCLIIDICKLKNAKLIPQPDSCVKIDGTDNDNCDGGNCSCYNDAHYVWAIDSNGNVHSACIGEECRANNSDGYQGTWP